MEGALFIVRLGSWLAKPPIIGSCVVSENMITSYFLEKKAMTQNNPIQNNYSLDYSYYTDKKSAHNKFGNKICQQWHSFRQNLHNNAMPLCPTVYSTYVRRD